MCKNSSIITSLVFGGSPGATVWQVDTVSDYFPFACTFAKSIQFHGRKFIYFNFHESPIVPFTNEPDVIIHTSPHAGFEPFVQKVLETLETWGNGAGYLFDCISPLAVDWYSDQMVGNFFVIICKVLGNIQASACFAVLRNIHSQYAIDPITTAAVGLLDVCRYEDKLYVQPLKLDKEVPSLQRLHVWEEGVLRLVPDSHTAASVLTHSRHDNLGLARHHLGIWSSTFIEAEGLMGQPPEPILPHNERAENLRGKIIRMAVTRDPRVYALVERYFSLEYLVFLGTRMLGTGLIGGKASDMLLARAILQRNSEHWADILEAHDSFFIPSDVFYTFLVQNDCWELRRQLLKCRDRMDIAREIQRRIIVGHFPSHIIRRFSDMLDYYGETPLAVRSSSLLEDSFGNAFSGKYESVFVCNRGSRSARLEEFILGVKRVYASAMNKDALDYRARQHLLDRDEQMAVLVQRVSGIYHDTYYFPHLAAVGFSFNPYVWHEDINPQSGVLRLVFGLGTRVVNRSDDDYTRLVALNAPMLRHEGFIEELPIPAQQRVDVLDLESGQIVSKPFRELAQYIPPWLMEYIATRDTNAWHAAQKQGIRNPFVWRLTFEHLLSKTGFVPIVQSMLRTLEQGFGTAVDIEFTVTFVQPDTFRIHLLQCRPMRVKGIDRTQLPDLQLVGKQVIFGSKGPVIGRSRFLLLDAIIFVVPEVYSSLTEKEHYHIASIIGELNRLLFSSGSPPNILLIGPGRWGSSISALGVPVSFNDINHVAVLCEILAIRENLVTEVSLGTHFFNDLVELDMLYVGLNPQKLAATLDLSVLENAPNQLIAFLPEAVKYASCIRLILPEDQHSSNFCLWADTPKQLVYLYFEGGDS